MKQTVKKITSLVLVLALSLVFLPLRADASTVSQEKNTAASQTLFRAQGNQISSDVCAELEKRNIEVKENTVIKLVSLGSGKGTAIQAFNRVGNTVTMAALTAIDEEGNPKLFTAADMAQTRGSGGDSISESPFNNSFSMTFMISFNYYSTVNYNYACIQPLTAMYIYYDSNQLYTVKNLKMDYDCTGLRYKKSASNSYYEPETTGTTSTYTHRITVNKANPNRSTYYANNNDPYTTNRALCQCGDIYGVQDMTYYLSYVRNSDNKTGSIKDYFIFDWIYTGT